MRLGRRRRRRLYGTRWAQRRRRGSPKRLIALLRLALAQRRDRARHRIPQRTLVVGERAAFPHDFGRARGVGTGSLSGSDAGLAAVVGSPFGALAGRGSGSGIALPASEGSSARGLSITNCAGFLMRPAMRPASTPEPK